MNLTITQEDIDSAENLSDVLEFFDWVDELQP
jgi:inhibitor of KinA sporulation pathway (predicted exonuclease)